MKRLLEYLMDLVARLPTTNARIAVSLLLAIATGIRVIVTWSDPPWEWLVFLGAMMGLDVAQWGIKRKTHKPELAGASAGPGTGQ